MSASAEASAVSRVHCRQIVESDLDALAGILTTGFPRHVRGFWEKGLARIAARPAIGGMPRIGYTLETDCGLVGCDTHNLVPSGPADHLQLVLLVCGTVLSPSPRDIVADHGNRHRERDLSEHFARRSHAEVHGIDGLDAI